MKYLAIGIAAFVAACSGGAPQSKPSEQSKEVSMDNNCQVRAPSDIAMWINAMPGMNDNPTLIAQFQVIAPTPGYTFALKVLEVRESFPPQYVFELVATPPDGLVTEVETATDVRVEIPKFEYAEIASATVRCGGSTLFELDSVETAY